MMRGDIIFLEEMDEEFSDGWWLGEHTRSGQKGLFPACMRPLHSNERHLDIIMTDRTMTHYF